MSLPFSIRFPRGGASLLLLLVAVALTRVAQAGDGVTFTNQAAALGLTNTGNTVTISWADWDGDGDPDQMVQNRPPFANGTTSIVVLYRNDLDEVAATFTDVSTTIAPALPNSIHNAGWSAAWADFDEDGDFDVYLGNGDNGDFGDNVLWVNEGGAFVDRTLQYGLTEGHWSQGSQWVDYNRDGLLDLYLTEEFVPFRMFRRNRDGSFTDVAAAIGLADPQAKSYGISWADFDGDGDADCVVSTCGNSQAPGEGGTVTVDRYFRNNMFGAGTPNFTEIGAATGFGYRGQMYGNEAGDPDNDGDWDVFVARAATAMSPSIRHRFYLNTGTFPWTDSATALGLAGGSGIGAHGLEWIDYDNDGDVDLWVQHNGTGDQLFHNNWVESTGMLGFTEMSASLGLTGAGSFGFDGGWADVDGDGDLDLATPGNGQNGLFINNGGNANNWLFVNLRGSTDTRGGTGATIKVTVGGVTQMRIMGGQAGAFSQNGLPAHFGLGAATEVDSITVEWITSEPSELAGPIAANQTLLIEQPVLSSTLATQ